MEWLRKLAPDIFAFSLGIALAWYFGWQTTDLIWSLWLGSLVLGYLTILTTLVAGVYIHHKTSRHPGIYNEQLQTGLTVSTPLALFLLAFFTLHFGGFHIVHAMLLNIFFPISGDTAINSSTVDLSEFFNDIVFKVIPFYGLFLIPLLVAERHTIFSAWKTARSDARRIDTDLNEQNTQTPTQAEEGSNEVQATGIDPSAFITPYKNVVRMHLLIFVFAFCQFLNIQTYWVFILVYFVYFFPWRHFNFGRKPVTELP